MSVGLAFAGAHTGVAPVEQGEKNVPEFEPAFEMQTRAPAISNPVTLSTETVVEGLAHPWGIEVLPGGGYLVTEREGRLRVIDAEGELKAAIKGVPQVLNMEQGGLLDVALAEDFEQSRRIFFTYAKPMEGNMSATAAATGVLNADMTVLSEVEDIFVQDPPSPSPMHYGSRIVLDGDYAYVTTGEHFTQEERVLAQDKGATYGKVIRVTLSGETPDDNPFVDEEGSVDTIWTLGHRNVQGADIHPETGDLWTLEHGPQGGDELNLIEAGANYGWPEVSYGEQYGGAPIGTGEPRAEGFTEPRYYWDPVIAPGGFTFYEGEMFDWNGDVIASSLYPGGLVRLTLDGDRVNGEARYLAEELGRVRDIEVDADGSVLVLTDYADGAVIRVMPATASN
ncbi:PQQ-dependent sugar dehydrogenase [Alphaproteobacteria bacterium GH1-50]|uniref:PQQ-dependent sugar dehydrogenase n=1 Tax=Kangsaoukella pontilimi TaxID=2691042 RepID=A0A7C9IH77_9RHOB|nr:PQQ-dependent sugar dehydrogenase [Kangsaoukella pontilimi]MXQ08848.1 PQQ-dependent sugar dehydrogenase [Kangsaoukella pontilimi]